MKSKQLFQRKHIVGLFIFSAFLILSIFIAFRLPYEKIGIGQAILSFSLFISVFLTLFISMTLLRHFTGLIKRSWKFDIFQFFFAMLISFLTVSIFSSSVVAHLQEAQLDTIKKDLRPVIFYIEEYQKSYGKTPSDIQASLGSPTTINNISYQALPKHFIVGVQISTIDIDGAQVFYDSRDLHWYRFNNDMYQYYQERKEKPPEIERFISFQKKQGLFVQTLRKKGEKWIGVQQKQKKAELKNQKKPTQHE